MSTYEPGTVAVATVSGIPNVRVTLDPNDEWFAHVEVFGRRWQDPEDVTDIRPLVVLDLDGYDGERAVTYLRNLARESRDVFDKSPSPRGKLANLIADQIEQQTKPPRIPEPGLWGVVEAGTNGMPATRRRFCRTSLKSWTLENSATQWEWAEFVDPALVRDGIEATS